MSAFIHAVMTTLDRDEGSLPSNKAYAALETAASEFVRSDAVWFRVFWLM